VVVVANAATVQLGSFTQAATIAKVAYMTATPKMINFKCLSQYSVAHK